MIDNTINEMASLVLEMQDCIKQDIEDTKQAKHEELLKRNNYKEKMIDKISNYKQQLNNEIMQEMQNGVDVNIYREKIDNLEVELKQLFELNRRLALIVKPIQEMYKDIVEEIAIKNGGSLVNVQA